MTALIGCLSLKSRVVPGPGDAQKGGAPPGPDDGGASCCGCFFCLILNFKVSPTATPLPAQIAFRVCLPTDSFGSLIVTLPLESALDARVFEPSLT